MKVVGGWTDEEVVADRWKIAQMGVVQAAIARGNDLVDPGSHLSTREQARSVCETLWPQGTKVEE